MPFLMRQVGMLRGKKYGSENLNQGFWGLVSVTDNLPLCVEQVSLLCEALGLSSLT